MSVKDYVSVEVGGGIGWIDHRYWRINVKDHQPHDFYTVSISLPS